MARPRTNLKGGNEAQLDSNLDALGSFYTKLSEMMEWRLHTAHFARIVDYLSKFDTEIISYMPDEIESEQLIFCSQYMFTLTQLRDELKLYLDRLTRQYNYWWANRTKEAKTSIYSEQVEDMKAGNRTKSTVGNISKDDVANWIFVNYEQDNEKWQFYMDKIRQSIRMFSNMADDIKSRSMILMSLKKEKSTF